jgi:hypothetical protein
VPFGLGSPCIFYRFRLGFQLSVQVLVRSALVLRILRQILRFWGVASVAKSSSPSAVAKSSSPSAVAIAVQGRCLGCSSAAALVRCHAVVFRPLAAVHAVPSASAPNA